MNVKPNIIKDKSYQFAIQIVHLYKEMLKQNEFILSKQIVRSGTSIGANACPVKLLENNHYVLHLCATK